MGNSQIFGLYFLGLKFIYFSLKKILVIAMLVAFNKSGISINQDFSTHATIVLCGIYKLR